VKAKRKIEKESKRFPLFTFYMPACLQNYFHGRLLSIRVFSSEGHYLTIRLGARDFYRVIFDEDAARDNYRAIEIEGE